MGYKVMLLSRTRSAYILSRHDWLICALIAGTFAWLMYHRIDGTETIDIWPA